MKYEVSEAIVTTTLGDIRFKVNETKIISNGVETKTVVSKITVIPWLKIVEIFYSNGNSAKFVGYPFREERGNNNW